MCVPRKFIPLQNCKNPPTLPEAKVELVTSKPDQTPCTVFRVAAGLAVEGVAPTHSSLFVFLGAPLKVMRVELTKSPPHRVPRHLSYPCIGCHHHHLPHPPARHNTTWTHRSRHIFPPQFDHLHPNPAHPHINPPPFRCHFDIGHADRAGQLRNRHLSLGCLFVR